MDPLSPPTTNDEAETLERTSARLPHKLRLLCVGGREPSWVGLTLQLDAAGCTEPYFRWFGGSADAMATLRSESFDCVLVSFETTVPLAGMRGVAGFDAVGFVQALRASGYEDAVVVLARSLDHAEWTDLLEHGADIFISPSLWESRALVAQLRTSLARAEMRRENHRLSVLQERRLVRERDEAEHLLNQQRQLIGELAELASPARGRGDQAPSSLAGRLPEQVNDLYHELLRTYVIMGSGNLGTEISQLAEVIAAAGMSPREALELHLERVEEVVRGLGSRSTRHVMARADLMALELMMHLGASYQLQARRAIAGPLASLSDDGCELG